MINSDPINATRMDRMHTDARQAEAKAVPATQGIGEAAVSAKTQVCSGFRGGLLIAVAITMWILLAPAFAASPSAMSRPMADVQAGLGKLLGCQWRGTKAVTDCPVMQMNGIVSLSLDPRDDTVETVEMNALVAGHPQPRPDEEKLSRDTVLHIVSYLLPTWKNSSQWLTDARHAAAHVRARKIIKVGGVTVLVQRLQPADLDDAVATIVIAKKASLKAWNWGDDC
jgi:hypothetical protein